MPSRCRCRRRPSPTLERFVELRARRRRPRRGRRACDRPRAEGGRRRPARRCGWRSRAPSAGPSCGRSSRRCPRTRRSARRERVPATARLDRRLRSRDAPAGHADRHARRAAASARADRDVRLRPDGVPAGAHRQRAAVRRLHVARAMARGERGYDVRLVHNITDVNDKIYEAAPGHSAELAVEATRWYLEDTPASGSGCRTRSRSRPRRSPRSSR